jgi:hypothetical protein
MNFRGMVYDDNTFIDSTWLFHYTNNCWSIHTARFKSYRLTFRQTFTAADCFRTNCTISRLFSGTIFAPCHKPKKKIHWIGHMNYWTTEQLGRSSGWTTESHLHKRNMGKYTECTLTVHVQLINCSRPYWRAKAQWSYNQVLLSWLTSILTLFG